MRLRTVLGVVAALFAVFAIWAGLSMRQAMKLLKDPDSIGREINPPAGPPTAADAVVSELEAAYDMLPVPKPLWGLGQGKVLQPTPGLTAAESALQARIDLRRLLVEKVTPDLEPAATTPALNQTHRFKALREMNNALLEDVLSLILIGRGPEARAVFAALERVRRLVGRGIEGSNSLIAKMIDVAMLGSGNLALTTALDRKLIDTDTRSALASVCQDGDSREMPLDQSVRAELAMVDRAVTAFDSRLGPVSVLTRLYWGDGHAQVARFGKALDDGTPTPTGKELQGMHVMVSIGVPNFTAARERVTERRGQRQGLIARMKSP